MLLLLLITCVCNFQFWWESNVLRPMCMYFSVIYLFGCKQVIVLNVEVFVVHSKDGLYFKILNIAILHQIAPTKNHFFFVKCFKMTYLLSCFTSQTNYFCCIPQDNFCRSAFLNTPTFITKHLFLLSGLEFIFYCAYAYIYMSKQLACKKCIELLPSPNTSLI